MPATSGRDAPPLRSGSSCPGRESSSSDTGSHTEEEEDQDQTIPMEVYTSQPTGASGHSWSDRVDEEETWGWQSSRRHKRRRGALDFEGDSWAALPFPFSDEARVAACEKLFNEARASMTANIQWVQMTLRHNIPVSECSDQGIAQLTNLLLIVVAEFHLMRSIRSCGPVLPTQNRGAVEGPQGLPASQ